MNTKALYAAGAGIAVAAIAIFFVVGSGNIRLPGTDQNPTSTVQEVELQIDLADIIVQRMDDRNASVQVVFTAYNPSRGTLILETIHYTLKVGNFVMTSGDIGVSPEGFVGSQAGTFTIVGNSTIILRDSRVAERNNLTADVWDNMVEGTAQYLVEGKYLYRVIGSNFETTPGEGKFSLTFP